MYFSYQLADRLKMTQSRLVAEMGIEEFNNWVAYYNLQDEKFRKDIENKVHYETAQSLSEDEKTRILRETLNRFAR